MASDAPERIWVLMDNTHSITATYHKQYPSCTEYIPASKYERVRAALEQIANKTGPGLSADWVGVAIDVYQTARAALADADSGGGDG